MNEYLEKAKITKNPDGSYTVDGVNVPVPTGKKVEWHFTRIYTDRDEQVTAVANLVSESTTTRSDVVSLKRTNLDNNNSFIEANSAKVAELMKSLRKNVTGTTRFEELASQGKYDAALREFG